MNTTEKSKYTVTLRNDNIMHIFIKSCDEFNLDDMHCLLADTGKLGNYKKYPNIIQFEDYINTTKDAREFAASNESNIYTICDAFVVQKTALKLLGNFYLSVHKPKSPTRIFDDLESAVKWIHENFSTNK